MTAAGQETTRESRLPADTTIIFLHIPKTAGQTVHGELVRAVGEEAVSPIRQHNQNGPKTVQDPPGYRLYSGHLDWKALDTVPGPRFVFTVLRDPLERIASFYLFMRRQAESIPKEELTTKRNQGLRMVLENSPDDYFFSGTPLWLEFIRDHYHSTYCSYLVTRHMRGYRLLTDLDKQNLVERALASARDLDGIYSVDDLGALERDLRDRLGITARLTGHYVNRAPEAGNRSRWDQLCAMIEKDETRDKLREFARADQMLLYRLGFGPRPLET
jgi:hypothetical protein